MSENKKRELEERIDRLEAKVEKLEEQLQQGDRLVVDVDAGIEAKPESGQKDTGPEIYNSVQTGESWLNHLGIGLLLLGVAFLFKYSIDQGWLIPPVRSAIGLGIGVALFITGFHMTENRTPLKQVLMGGGIAAFYITGFATFQLYSFIPHPVVWVFMVMVTLLALSLSLQQDVPILSVTGTLGGLGTPFMLYTGSGSLIPLISYTSLILIGTGVIYLYKGWRSLLWSMVAGGWLVLFVGLVNNIWNVAGSSLSDRLALQTGVIIALIFFWILPVVRELLISRNLWRWPIRSDVPDSNFGIQVLALLIPIGSFIYSMALWNIEWKAWGVVAMACSIIIGYMYLSLRDAGLKSLGSIHGFSCLILLTMSFFLLLEGDLLFVVLALEGLGLRIVAHWAEDKRISFSSHMLSGVVALWLLEGMVDNPSAGIVILNMDALTRLFIIGIIGLAVPVWLRKESNQLIYRLGAHIALLGWFLHEFYLLENGQAFVSVSWGLYAVSMLILGWVKGVQWLRLAGMVTIFLVVGKLFLVDLSQLQAIWRILLFIGFGVVFLIIGYFIQTKFGDEPKEDEEPARLKGSSF